MEYMQIINFHSYLRAYETISCSLMKDSCAFINKTNSTNNKLKLVLILHCFTSALRES